MPHYDANGTPLVLSRNTTFIANQVSDIEELIKSESWAAALLTIDDTLRELHHSNNAKTNGAILFRHQATALTGLGRTADAEAAIVKAKILEAGAKRTELGLTGMED